MRHETFTRRDQQSLMKLSDNLHSSMPFLFFNMTPRLGLCRIIGVLTQLSIIFQTITVEKNCGKKQSNLSMECLTQCFYNIVTCPCCQKYAV
jgi:hypothetical protein